MRTSKGLGLAFAVSSFAACGSIHLPSPTSSGKKPPQMVSSNDSVPTVDPATSSSAASPVPLADTTNPTAPTGLLVTFVSPTIISLRWSPASDDVSVASYIVQRCSGVGCTTFARATPEPFTVTTQFSDQNLRPFNSYTYRVRAVDTSGNLSAFSATATAQTLKGVKWFPGHYLMAAGDDFTLAGSPKLLRVLRGADGALFRGILMYMTWGQIETTAGTDHWEKVDSVLAQLPPGKKLAVVLSWQAFTRVAPPCPADMIGNPDYDGGYRMSNKEVPYSTIHLTRTMDRYRAFVRRFAARYDVDQRIAFVTSAEIPYETELKTGLYNDEEATANIMRLPAFMGRNFPNSPSGMLGEWWSMGGNREENIRQLVSNSLASHIGFGAPDIYGGLADQSMKTHFSDTFLANAGKWPFWLGMEYPDLVPPRAVAPFPEVQLGIARSYKANFIWWHTSNRRQEGGFDFDNDVVPYLRAHPNAGITVACPDNIVCK